MTVGIQILKVITKDERQETFLLARVICKLVFINKQILPCQKLLLFSKHNLRTLMCALISSFGDWLQVYSLLIQRRCLLYFRRVQFMWYSTFWFCSCLHLRYHIIICCCTYIVSLRASRFIQWNAGTQRHQTYPYGSKKMIRPPL